MSKEEIDLLLKDLCGRLPYGVKIEVIDTMIVGKTYKCVDVLDCYNLNRVKNKHYSIKPYLRPLSSMTEEQKRESPFELSLLNAFINGYISLFEDEELTAGDIVGILDWLNKNHFDYRGLIEKKLAIDCTGLNIY